MLGRLRRTPRAASPAPTTPVIPGYRDMRPIGSGGFSRVYSATQERFGRTVAVKVITVELSDDALRRFGREQMTAGRLDGHPHVIRVYESGFTEAGQPYLTMELHERGALSDRLRREGPLPVAEVLAIGVKLACALDAAHRHNVVHRDVKPQNVLVSPFVGPVLADFGIAAVDDVRLGTVTGEAFSALHVAPEVLDGRPATPAADLYSLASTLYELLTGRAPHADAEDEGLLGLMRRVRTGDVPPIERDDVPAVVATELVALLRRPPEDRPPSGLAMAEWLRDLEGRADLPVTPLVPDGRPTVPLGAAALPPTDVGSPETGPVAGRTATAGARAAEGVTPEVDEGDPTPPAPVGPASLDATVTGGRRGSAAPPSPGPDAPGWRRAVPIAAVAAVAVLVAALLAWRLAAGDGDGAEGGTAGTTTTASPGATSTAPPTTAAPTPTAVPTTAPVAPTTTGPAAPAPPPGSVTVPEAGAGRASACEPIEAAGLGCDLAPERSPVPVRPEAVLRQEPAAGGYLMPGDNVVVYYDDHAWAQIRGVRDPATNELEVITDGVRANRLHEQGWDRWSIGVVHTEPAPGTVPLYCLEPTGAGPNRSHAYVLDPADAGDPDWWRACPAPVLGHVYPLDGDAGEETLYEFGSVDRYYSNNPQNPYGLAYLGDGENGGQPVFRQWAAAAR